MLLRETDRPFRDAGWIFEEKHDGYRATFQDGRLWSRTGIDFDHHVDGLDSLPAGLILDGELVAMKNGKSSLNALQRKEGLSLFVVFDVLCIDGQDVTDLPLLERRTLLEKLQLPDGVRLVEQHTNGSALFRRMKREGREGIVAKRLASRYRAGERTCEWLKIKVVSE